MAQLRQSVIEPPCDIVVFSYAWTHSHIAARDILQQKPGIIGVDVERDEDGELHEVVLATTSRVYRISAPSQRRGMPDTALSAILCGRHPGITLVAFDLAPISLCISDRTQIAVKGVELNSTLGDAQMAPSEIIKRHMSSTKVQSFNLDNLWAPNNISATATSLRAWISVMYVSYSSIFRFRSLMASISVGNNCKSAEQTLLAKLIREEWILRRAAPREVQSEFTSHQITKEGRLLLTNARYKTRVRASRQTRVIINYENQESTVGRATGAHGRRSEIKIKRGVRGQAISSVTVVGAPSRTNAERARDEFILDVCCGRKPGLQSYAFIRHLWFPVAEELQGEIHESVQRRSIYGLNQSQSEVVGSMVHSPRPCIIVHGPPGTGKTKTISAAVEVWAKHGRATWAVAHSNVAVKNIAESIARRGVDFRLIVSQDFYVEWHESIYTAIEQKLIRSDEFPPDTGSLARFIGDARVILSTVSMLSNPKLEQLRMYNDVMPVERLVIDEASQINVFDYMPLCAKFKKLRKICFFGDPKQLPPYGKDNARTIESIYDLSHLTRYSHFLNTQYRMPVPLGDFISDTVYGGRLMSAHQITDPSCIVFVDARRGHGGGEELQGCSQINRDEVQVIRNLVEQYHRAEKNFCVITPYDAQRAEISRDLESVGLPSDRVFNVDSFQGTPL
ncbi:P-loop containing nucleoside triphosphate hydrolase protein [Schizophyllum amplum]|uniref:P-loop containing nucleoside triphosphate hydrolase protein n=1 Tax=Schizophyllum amplum TaxID=97359 RepID=A0A550BZQ0_9AGAR|nr:P-loop containing nucleoside triphosphate hydrolase protein [Auriculariopsis ampla]